MKRNKTRYLNTRQGQVTFYSYVMLVLPLIGFFVFSLYPIIWQFKWAFYNYDQIPSHTRFVGMDNFVRFFNEDLTYWRTWGNTIKYAVIKVPIELCFALFLAAVINQKCLKGKGFYRAMFYAPVVVSTVVISVIFCNLFGYFGVINNWLLRLGIITENIDWFASPSGSMAVLVISSIWHTFGTNVLYFVAALANVPEDCYESAKLDGANRFQVFFKITLPLISSVFRIILLLSILGTLSIGEFVITLTGGGPAGSTETVTSYLTQQFVPGFADTASPAIGYGCAMSIVTTIVFAIIGLAYSKLSAKKAEPY